MLVNKQFQDMNVYTSKDLSLKAKADPKTTVLSFGEPDFGPPSYLSEKIKSDALDFETFLDGTSRYESPRGSKSLRESIAKWYLEKHNINVDPETEIMITHGGVEAINLSILCTAGPNENIMVSQPSYMLYQRTIDILSRNPVPLERSVSQNQYQDIFSKKENLNSDQNQAKSILINSPENPSGYVVSEKDWDSIAEHAESNQVWVIHDEVYDTMEFERKHYPSWHNKSLRKNSIMINSFSKKFGIPGLRIGWMVAPSEVINLATKLHDYMYLGVNIQYEKIAETILNDKSISGWLDESSEKIRSRRDFALKWLTTDAGFVWDRHPHGAMFLFPNVSGVYKKIPEKYKGEGITVGEAVAKYFLEEKNVSVVPGYVYGDNSKNHIRMVLCIEDIEFESAIKRLIEDV